MTNEAAKRKLPRGIHRCSDGRYRIYATRNGKPQRLIVSWELLNQLKVPVPATRLQQPGLELARAALVRLQSNILTEQRTGAIEASAKTKVGDLFPLVKQDYRQQGLKDWDHVESRWDRHLKTHFANIVAGELSTDDIQAYIASRSDEGAGNGTVNRELCIVRRALKLGLRTHPPRVRIIPHFPKLTEPKARQGFLSDETYDKLTQECFREGLWLRGMVAVGGNFGWRKSEVLNLQVRQLDFSERTIRLDSGETKNNEGRLVSMTNDVYQLLSACAAGKGPQDFVFTRDDGQRIHDFRLAWSKACERAGCPDLLFHDLRRTGARNLRRLGVSEGVIMRIGGWKTRNVFERYNIIDQADLADAARRLDEKRAATAIETDTKTDQSDTHHGATIAVKSIYLIPL